MKHNCNWNVFWLAGCILLLLIAWIFAAEPYFNGSVCIPWDARTQFYPYAAFTADSLLNGDLPLWNPYLFGGYPFIADPQNMFFSPIMTTGMLLAPLSMDIAWFDCLTLLHLLVGGIGMLFILRSFGLSPPAAVFGALLFMFGGPAAARLQHTPIILAYGYGPWAFLALKNVLDKGGWLRGILFGIATGLLGVHFVQVTYLFALTLLLYFIYRMVAEQFSMSFFRRSIGPLLLGSALTLFMIAPQLIATFSFLPYTNRQVLPLDAIYPLRAISFITVLFPNIFNNIDHIQCYWGKNDITVSYMYIGVLPLLLMAFIPSTKIFRDKRIVFPILLGLFSIIYSLGVATPIYALLYDWLPGVKLFRRPSDAAFILIFALAIALPIIFDNVLDVANWRKPLRDAAPRIIIATLLLTAGIAFSYALNQQRPPGGAEDFLSFGAILIGVGLCLTLMHSENPFLQRSALIATILLLLVDYNIHNIANHMNGHKNYTHMESFSRGQIQRRQFFKTIHKNISQINQPDYRSLFVLSLMHGFNTPSIAKVETIQGYNPMNDVSTTRFIGKYVDSIFKYIFTNAAASFDATPFDLIGLRYIFSEKNILDIDASLHNATGSFHIYGGISIWENTNVMPRLYSVNNIFVDNATHVHGVPDSLPELDYSDTVVLDRWPDELPRPDHPAALTVGVTPGNVIFHGVAYSNNKVTIQLESEDTGLVVLSDRHYPTWKAFLDNERVTIYTANYLFRAVVVPPGKHTLKFSYHPFTMEVISNLLRTVFLNKQT